MVRTHDTHRNLGYVYADQVQPRLQQPSRVREPTVLLVTSGLPRHVWVLQGGVILNFFGNGLVAPYLLLYLHSVRDISLPVASLAMASGGVFATASGLVAGPLIDRFGPRICLALAMSANAVAYAAYTQVGVPWQSFAAGLAVGVGTGAYGPSAQSLLSAIVGREQRAAALSQQRMSAVLGLSLGGLAGGVLVAVGLAQRYTTLLVLDSLTFVLFALVVLRLPDPRPAVDRGSGGYRVAVRDRRLRLLAAVNLVMVGASIAPMMLILPAFAQGTADVPAAAIGMIYAINAAGILLAQLRITTAVSGRAPLRTLAIAAGGWAAAWAIVVVTGAALRGWPAIAALAVGMVVYAAGECVYTATLTPSAVAIAPDHLRGRYLAIIGFTWQAGFSIGPPIASAVLATVPLAFPCGECAACMILAVVLIGLRPL